METPKSFKSIRPFVIALIGIALAIVMLLPFVDIGKFNSTLNYVATGDRSLSTYNYNYYSYYSYNYYSYYNYYDYSYYYYYYNYNYDYYYYDSYYYTGSAATKVGWSIAVFAIVVPILVCVGAVIGISLCITGRCPCCPRRRVPPPRTIVNNASSSQSYAPPQPPLM